MAFVAISGNLRQDVKSKILDMSIAEVNSLGNAAEPKIFGTEPWLQEKMWGNRLHLLPQIEDWCRVPECIDFRIKTNWDGNESTLSHGTHIHIRMKNTHGIKVPPIYRGDFPDIYLGFTPEEELPAELTAIAQLKTQQDEARKRWNKVGQQVISFLDSCKSLNEGLKLWPDLRMYIPPEYMDRVNRKPERKESKSDAAQALAQLNTDELQAAVVIARMSGAAV